jgi:hypothetical protein
LPQAGGPRCCTAAAFASLKKYAAHFFNLGLAETESKEAAYAAAGVNSEKCFKEYILLQELFNWQVIRIVLHSVTASEK